jgi:hypothetical protein
MAAGAAATLALAVTVDVGAPSLTVATRPAEHVAPHAVILQPAVLERRTRVHGLTRTSSVSGPARGRVT